MRTSETPRDRLAAKVRRLSTPMLVKIENELLAKIKIERDQTEARAQRIARLAVIAELTDRGYYKLED